ncbi:hypothetical protein BBP40_010434 [Aspergillus hancockii]|nr:hypothetical protein BBP40_010434 [Aspergillus hancockii]
MQLQLLTLLSLTGLSSFSWAAECWNYNGGHNWVRKDELTNYGTQWCNNNWNTLSGGGWAQFTDSNGNTAQIGQIGKFSNVEQCYRLWQCAVNCEGTGPGGACTEPQGSLALIFYQW